MRVTRSTGGSDRYCVLDSGFGHAATVVELRKKGKHSTIVIKKIFWTKKQRPNKL